MNALVVESIHIDKTDCDVRAQRWNKLRYSALAYLSVLVLLAVVFPTHSTFTSDDGALAAQVLAWSDGTPELSRLPPVVPEIYEGWPSALVTADGPVPYPWGPAYIGILRLSSGSGTFAFGLQIPSILGAVLIAASAWKLAERLHSGLGQLAFWVAAAGPAVVNSTALWGHNLAAGLSGVALVCFVRVGFPKSVDHRPAVGSLVSQIMIVTLGALATAGAALAKDEAVLWVISLTLVAWFVVRSPGARITTLAYGMAASMATLAERQWIDDLIERDVHRTQAAQEALSPWRMAFEAATGNGMERLRSALGSLVWPSDLNYRWSWLVMAVAVCVLLVALLVRRRGHHRLAVGLMMLCASLYLVRAVVGPIDRVSGLLVAWPIVLVALAVEAGPKLSNERGVTRILAAVIVVYCLLVFVTQHPGGAGLEWGGRYLSSAAVAISAVVAVRIVELWPRYRPALVGLIMFPALAGLMVSYQTHQLNTGPAEAVYDLGVDAAVSAHGGSARLAWSTAPLPWYTADGKNLVELLEILEEAGHDRVALLRFYDDLPAMPDHYKLDTLDDGVVVVHLVW